MFNKLINPKKIPSFDSEAISSLFYNNSIGSPTTFKNNHYVPLTFFSEKVKVNKKRELLTSQRSKESRK